MNNKRSSKLTQAAQGESCALRIPGVCTFDPSTVVLAHIKSVDKGTAHKSPDWWGVFACHACHAAIDGPDKLGGRKYEYILDALYETLKKHIANGRLYVG